MSDAIEYTPYDPAGPTVQRTIFQPSELLGPQYVPLPEPEAPAVPPERPARPKRPTRLRVPRERLRRRTRDADDADALLADLPPVWQRLYQASQPAQMEADERERRAQVAADARQSGQEILRELDAVVAPSDWRPEAMHARLAVLRQLRASAGVPAALEWNESRTVSRWAAEPSLAALVFDQVEDWLRRAASAGG